MSKCEDCSGRGVFTDDCGTCDGNGWDCEFCQRGECADCDGSGECETECDICGGSGEVEDAPDSEPDPNVVKVNP